MPTCLPWGMATTPKSAPATDRHGSPTGIREHAAGLLGRARELRRDIHRWPEIGLDLPKTRARLLSELEDLPLDITLHKTTSGVVALLTGDKPGPTVMLRGDMDALPMPENTGLDFASRVDNCMHACGHDTHVAMLSSAARMLSERKADLPGRVLFMFQPGEEGYGGAEYMLNEGLLDVPKLSDGTSSPIAAAYAIHITSSMPAGYIGTRGGPIMASSDRLEIVITGKGGHASEPFRTLDPVPVACEIIQALQMFVTRRIDIFDPTVITITKLISGTAYNVIPEVARVEGTIRALSDRTRKNVHDGIRRVAEGIASAHDMSAEVIVELGYPVTVNDTPSADFALDIASSIVGEGKTARMPTPIMGAEDFSYVLEKLPGAMVFLGGTPAGMDPSKAPPNHSNRVTFDEDAMTTGIALYSAMALRTLGVMLD
ncbi:MAG: M20 family metallopeptidase [Actinomycetota bacterium]